MSRPFRDRPPSASELEQIRLILSTYKDGSGMQILRNGTTVPGWRDAERAVAAALGGRAIEGKGVFDVLLPSLDHPLPYGLSIKTSKIQNEVWVLSELHNSSKKAHDHLDALHIDWNIQPTEAGTALVEQVLGWHREVERSVDVRRSSYVHLVHDQKWQQWRLLWYPLDLLQPVGLDWVRVGARISAVTKDGHRLWEWYGASGGQLKWYPKIADAKWDSGYFHLETPAPLKLRVKAADLFGQLWDNANA